MMKVSYNKDNAPEHTSRVENYYRFHSHIYDATRWTFLFGRDKILEMITDMPERPRILEIGCGTGTNIKKLKQHFPDARITGIDLSDDMLEIARKKMGNQKNIQFLKLNYGFDPVEEASFDLILFSYSLTMFDYPIEHIFEQISRDLNHDGYIAVVDFNTSPAGWFRQWMKINHVDLSGHLFPLLKKYFTPLKTQVNSAYLGLWSYFLFLGRLPSKNI